MTMNQGDSRKDKPGFSSRRRPRGFDSTETLRNSGPFTLPVQPSQFSHGMAMSHHQSLSFWPSASYHHHHHPHNGHHTGAMHRYPGHQMFLQHGPFGNDSNQFRPVGYLRQFPLRFPHRHEPQHSSVFNNDLRRNGYGYQQDKRHFEESFHNRFDVDHPNYCERGLKSEQGIRPKATKFQKGKVKVYKKRRNQNNSSNVSGQDGETEKDEGQSNPNKRVPRENDDDDPKSVAGEKDDPEQNETKNVFLASQMNPCCCRVDENSQTGSLEETKEALETRQESHKLAFSLAEGGGNARESDEEDGAVGGEIAQSNVESSLCVAISLDGDSKTDICSFDKNLVDEGAICDLDKIFQYQEFSRYSDDSSDGQPSDSDLPAYNRQTADHKRLGTHRFNGGPYATLSDDESEAENCSYVYDHHSAHLRRHGLGSAHPHCSCQANRSSPCSECRRYCFNRESREDLCDERRLDGALGNHVGGENSDDGEDTGDFIDTDLPSHNKHILSSSDEMDNLSSCSNSDQEEENHLRLGYDSCMKTHSDFNCNDLSSVEPKVRNELETLSIREDTNKLNGCLSSHLHQGNVDSDSIQISPVPLHRVPIEGSCSSSSGSENGDSSPLRSPLQQNSVHTNSVSHVCYNPTGLCLDGAAASQLPQECHDKLLDNRYNSCPPGAECELPPPSLSQCFHSNVICLGARSVACNKSILTQSPGREHVAFTASSELDPSDSCPRPQNLDSAGCSITADGGACCPSGYQLSRVNNLNVCCQLSHSHLANGFSDDSPGANFSNDESNKHQKVFVKFPAEEKVDEGESHSASSCDLEDLDGFSLSSRKQDKSSDSGGSEDPLSHDSGDSVDMVLLPMEEEIEPVHHMSAGLCAGGVEDSDDCYADIQGQLAMSGSFQGANVSHLCDEHQYLCAHDQNPLRNGLPSKEFYELIKTVSTTDSYMRFFDKDGQDVQRQPVIPCDDEPGKQNSTYGIQNSKTERLKVDRVMIWNEYEAYVMQFKQIAVSACGQTAVLNVLKALKFSCEKSAVCKVIQTSLRKEDACIPEYLFSRARAGTTAEELMSGVEKLSGGTVGGRFFHFWPPRKVKLLQWLAYWMKRGAIPMATLNLQQGPHSLWQVPDSWHHQMVYGVSHQGLYLTNPLEIVSERSAMKQLCSDSVLMVRRQDIISRFRETTDLSQLLNHPDPRWRTMNVLGQVVNVLREFNMPSVPGYRLQVTSHVSIPASYKAGITLFMRKDRSAWNTLLNAPEIPLEQ